MSGFRVDPNVRSWFDAVDLDKSNSIDVTELQRALKHAKLDLELSTCAMLIRMNDVDRKGAINVEEFQHMHNFIMSVRNSFFQFDHDRNGHLDRDELIKALQVNNFLLDPPAFNAVFDSFDVEKKNYLDLSSYIAMAAFLTNSRAIFSRFDPYGAGRITLDFNQFCYAMSFLR